MIDMQSLSAHGRVHLSSLYFWYLNVRHSSSLPPSTICREECVLPSSRSFVALTSEGKAATSACHLSAFLTCTHAVKDTKSSVWVLSAWLGELEGEFVLYWLVWRSRHAIVPTSCRTKVCGFDDEKAGFVFSVNSTKVLIMSYAIYFSCTPVQK